MSRAILWLIVSLAVPLILMLAFLCVSLVTGGDL